MKNLILFAILVFSCSASQATIKEIAPPIPDRLHGILMTDAEAQELFDWLPIDSVDSPYCIEYDYSNVYDIEDAPGCSMYHKEPERVKILSGRFSEEIVCSYNPKNLYHCYIHAQSWQRGTSVIKAFFSERASDNIGKVIKTESFQSSSNTKFFCNELVPHRTYDCFLEFDK